MAFHHVATDGCCDVDALGVEEREVMKSETMALWDGLNFPYHMRLMEILPLRRGPLWYWNLLSCCSDDSESLLAAELKWRREMVRNRVKRTLEDTRDAICGFIV